MEVAEGLERGMLGWGCCGSGAKLLCKNKNLYWRVFKNE
jgi:hypothetical protein